MFGKENPIDGEKKKKAIAALEECFEGLPDPRLDRRKKHQALDILVIAICAVLGGCKCRTDIER